MSLSKHTVAGRSERFHQVDPARCVRPSAAPLPADVEGQHGFDTFQFKNRHEQPINAQRDAAAFGQSMTQRFDQPRIDWRRFLAAYAAQPVFAPEATQLFIRIGQFLVAIGQLHLSQEHLEAFGRGLFSIADARQRSLFGQEIADDSDALAGQGGLHDLREQQVQPLQMT
jgi:hypothetical protein